MSALDVRGGPTTMRRMAPLRAALVPLALWAVAGCGLLGVGREPIDFRTYELRGLPYERVAPLVLEVPRRYLTEGYDGVALAWDPDARTVRLETTLSAITVKLTRSRSSLPVHRLCVSLPCKATMSPFWCFAMASACALKHSTESHRVSRSSVLPGVTSAATLTTVIAFPLLVVFWAGSLPSRPYTNA